MEGPEPRPPGKFQINCTLSDQTSILWCKFNHILLSDFKAILMKYPLFFVAWPDERYKIVIKDFFFKNNVEHFCFQ